MTSAMQNVLFDIGGVLLHLDYDQALRRLAPYCPEAARPAGKAVFSLLGRDPVVAEYERGAVSLSALFERFVAVTGFSGTLEDFKDIWGTIFAENEAMIAFGHELARTYDVYFMSNAGALHIPALYERYPRLRFFKDDAVSCYLGALKPERAFFEKALSKFGIQAERSLFIDDRPENIAGARAYGLHAVQYARAEQTIADVKRMLSRH